MQITPTLKATYETNNLAKEALKKLADSGYNIKQLSILSTNLYLEEHVIDNPDPVEQMRNETLKFKSEMHAANFTLVVRGSDIELEQVRQILKLHIPKEQI